MQGPRFKFAELDEQGMQKLKAMEDAYGSVVLAVEPRHTFAQLSDQQVERVRALEQDLGVVLIAFQE